jgi:hypothetical protein
MEENLREGDHVEYPGIRWEVNIKMYLQPIWWGGGYFLDWSGSGQGQVLGTCKCDNEPSGSIKCLAFLTSWEPVSFSRRTLGLISMYHSFSAIFIHFPITDTLQFYWAVDVIVKYHTFKHLRV